MTENSKIEWTDHTFNPFVGCTKVSPACDFCYAESWAKRAGSTELWQGQRRRTTAANWQQPRKWNKRAGDLGRRERVFCASLADVFDNQVPARWRDDLWHLIDQTPHLDWLLLTKRPQNIAKMLPDPRTGTPPWGDGWPNVWLGTTVENQEEAGRRIPHLLLAVPAVVHFLSCEPLLGPVDLTNIDYVPFLDSLRRTPRDDPDSPYWPQLRYDVLRGHMKGPDDIGLPKVDWVITGGESGPKARPTHPDWFRSLRDQCAAAGVAYLHKQNGEWAPGELVKRHKGTVPVASLFDGRWTFGRESLANQDGHIDDEPDVYRVGKVAAGRLLDGVQHDGMPT